jgi:hypothetical protein
MRGEAVRGTVLSPEGNPVPGVLVMGADLNYAETDSGGRFKLLRPELALFFWCSGFLPQVVPIPDGENQVNIVLRRAA